MDQLNIVKKDGANYELYELNGALNAYTMGEFQDTLYETSGKFSDNHCREVRLWLFRYM